MRVHVDLVVSDVRATSDFYKAVGIDVPELWEHNGEAHHVEVDDAGLGFNSRTLTQGYDPRWPDASGVVLIFHLPTRAAVDEKVTELSRAGHRVHLAPIDAFWGARYAIVHDPDGNHVGLMSPSDAEHRGAPGFD